MDAPDSGERTSGYWMKVVALVAAVVLVASLGVLNHLVYEAIPPPLLPPMEPAEGVGSLSAQVCAGCHGEIAREWAGSFHARATSDPLYEADLAHQGEPYYCDHCHAPLVEQRPRTATGLWSPWPRLYPRWEENPRYQAGLRSEGVTCVSCHQRDGAMVGPHSGVASPHPVKVSDELRDPEACAGCHVLDVSIVGDLRRPLADTLAEWRVYRDLGGEQVCVDCHMPLVGERPIANGGEPRPSRDHRLLGAFDGDFVRAGLGVEDVHLLKGGDGSVEASLSLVNRAGHRIPTAEPHRKVEVSLTLVDHSGTVLRSSRQLVQRLVDLETLTEPPGGDTTLLPMERRDIRLIVPGPAPAGATQAILRVVFVLWDPKDPLAKAAGMESSQLHHEIMERSLVLGVP